MLRAKPAMPLGSGKRALPLNIRGGSSFGEQRDRRATRSRDRPTPRAGCPLSRSHALDKRPDVNTHFKFSADTVPMAYNKIRRQRSPRTARPARKAYDFHMSRRPREHGAQFVRF